jgi:hypothetical protein
MYLQSTHVLSVAFATAQPIWSPVEMLVFTFPSFNGNVTRIVLAAAFVNVVELSQVRLVKRRVSPSAVFRLRKYKANRLLVTSDSPEHHYDSKLDHAYLRQCLLNTLPENCAKSRQES